MAEVETHSPFERPADIGPQPEPLGLANFILWQFLQLPSGGLYATWDPHLGKAVWFLSAERDYVLRTPRCDRVIYEEHLRLRFRSVVFRLGSLGGDSLCGSFEFQRHDLPPRRYTVHSSFFPADGLWIAITSRDEL